jgi:acyl-CoA thioesterase
MFCHLLSTAPLPSSQFDPVSAAGKDKLTKKIQQQAWVQHNGPTPNNRNIKEEPILYYSTMELIKAGIYG